MATPHKIIDGLSRDTAHRLLTDLTAAGVPAELRDTHAYGSPDDDTGHEWTRPGAWFGVRYAVEYDDAVRAGQRVARTIPDGQDFRGPRIAAIQTYLTAHPVTIRECIADLPAEEI